MRKGQNPAKMGLPAYQPKRVGIALLSWIPSQEGYFSQALEILKIQITSIYRSTQEFDLFVFDNGSCPEVQDELQQLHKLGLIHFLFLANRNLGKTGALNWILSALPNELICFSDGDVLFRPGWLEKSLEILHAFPAAGLVSVQPCLFDILKGKEQAHNGMENDPSFRLSNRLLDPVVVEEYGRGVGLDPGKIEELKLEPVLIVEEVKSGVRAVIGQSHMQFIMPREVARKVLPLPSSHALFRQETKIINEHIDQLGLLQLTSLEAFVYHMGNQLDGTTLEEIQRTDLGAISPHAPVMTPFSSQSGASPSKKRAWQMLRWAARSPFIKKTLLRLYNLLFEFFAQEK
jgi:glycosyltransferase involved in cell wall biosynthesis